MNASNATFQSNHHRGYFSRNKIISSGGRNSRPPPSTTTSRAVEPNVNVVPLTLVSTITIGIATMIRNAVVSRFSG